eukprot:TRINITY_DN869_c0_g3_i2.p10 TRINITY_DN869_c0_g3~~TRINITY_DN869_c0_g3_i2.p10  ORF type:complete len:115 (+),score=15.83 TRINITY_DN869_c0_g3_i2:2393-2737(+)
MRFVLLLVLLALVATVFMKEHKKVHHKIKKYFHKKMCYCIKAKKGICWKLKCCEIYKYVPYKVFIKICKYGKCKFVKVKKHKKHVKKPEKKAGLKLQASLTLPLQLIPRPCLYS